MQTIGRTFTVVAIEAIGDPAEAQVIAESHFEAITFICRLDNLPKLYSKVLITIEQE